jgi:hypothetical protein
MKKKVTHRQSSSTQLVHRPRTTMYVAHQPHRRNAGPEPAVEQFVLVPPPRRPKKSAKERLKEIKEKLPPWQQVAASVAGGGGATVVGSLLSLAEWDPTYVGLGMTGLGLAGALLLPPGVGRIFANGVATAGVGQLAEGFVRKKALEHMATKVKETAEKYLPHPSAPASKPSNARYMPLPVAEAFANARRIDDEERMIDPDLALG